MAEAAPTSSLPSQADPLVRRFVLVRRARDLAERLLGLGAWRLAEPPADWWGGENLCDVGSPSSVEGFLLVHAGVSPRRTCAARERVRAEARMPALKQARAQGRFPETTIRLMAVKATPATVSEWIADGAAARASGGFADLNRVLRAAVRPAPAKPAEPAAPEAPPDAPPNADLPAEALAQAGRETPDDRQASAGETPTAVRARVATQRHERAHGLAPSTVLRLDLKLSFSAWQHGAWWQAAQRVRGERRDTPTSSLVFTSMLDHFGEAGAALEAPASLADVEPERRVYVDPVPLPGPAGEQHRAWLSTNEGRLAIDVAELERRECKAPKVMVRKVRGKNVAPTEAALRKEFPELFWDPWTEEGRRRVRELLGYPADTPATRPEPPVPPAVEQRHRPAPIEEDAVDPAIIETLDPNADALPDLDAAQTRAVTASAPRVQESLRWHELAALAALHEAEQRGARPPGTVRRACEAEGVSQRSRQEALWTWERLATRPALTAACRAGLEYSMVRALARLDPGVVEPWIVFARAKSVAVVEAHIRAVGAAGLPPVVPTGMEPLLPVGATVTEDIHADLSPAQQQTLARLRAMLDRLHGRTLRDAELYAAIAGWYVRRRTRVKKPRLTVVYHRSPETRVPIELRREASATRVPAAGASASGAGACRGDLRPTLERHLPWILAVGATVAGGWVEPAQKPGQDHVPVAVHEAVLDRDGHRCTTWFCPHNLVPTYNHGIWRRAGGKADPDTDQMQSLGCNLDHSNGALVVENRPDGGVWCWDGSGRRHGTVAPVARHLDAPLRRRLLALAAQQLSARAAVAAPPTQVRESRAPYGRGDAQRRTHNVERHLGPAARGAQRFAALAPSATSSDTG